jgi:hypothetical protein
METLIVTIEELKKLAEKFGMVGDDTREYILNERGQKILRTQINATQGKRNDR